MQARVGPRRGQANGNEEAQAVFAAESGRRLEYRQQQPRWPRSKPVHVALLCIASPTRAIVRPEAALRDALYPTDPVFEQVLTFKIEPFEAVRRN